MGLRRKEEDKSYALPFLVASVALVAATGWTIWRETVDLRPWKRWQRAYYAIEQQALTRELGETRALVAGGERGPTGIVAVANAAAPRPNSSTGDLARAKARLEELERNLRESQHTPISIQQIYIPEMGVVDRCKSCHVGIDRPMSVAARQPFTAHPGRAVFLDPHPSERVGCTVCHAGQGRATSSVSKAHGRVEYWESPLLDRQHTAATCLKCHRDNLETLRGATPLATGAELVRRYACYGCHVVPGFEALPRPGPPLGKIGEKVNYSFLVQWIQSPRSIVADARMPDFGLTDEEAHNVADFLFSFTRRERIDVPAPQPDARLVDEGKRLFNTSRCSICHRVEERGGANKQVYAPDLSIEGSKVQSAEWIADRVREPGKYFPDTVMPRFRFTAKERTQLASYIAGELVDGDLEEHKLRSPQPIDPSSVDKGRALVARFGCFGCHEIPGFEKEGKLGADLSKVGAKPLERFDFTGLRIDHGRAAWFQTKLKTPRAFRGDLRMPNYHLADDEVQALTTLLLGLTGEALPAELVVRTPPSELSPAGAAGKLIRDLKCLTCHSIRGRGGKFAPDLSFEGSAVERGWLKQFLKAPDLIRPLLEQMPVFHLTDEEATTLADFISMTLTDPRIPDTGPSADRALMAKGRALYERSGCRSCHQMDESGGAVGPNLTEVGTRLTAGYLLARTQDARMFRPAIVEPHYGFTEEEATALAAFFTTLGGNRSHVDHVAKK